MSESDRVLAEALVAQGYLSRDQAEGFLATHRNFQEVLVEAGIASKDTIGVLLRSPHQPPEPPGTRMGKFILVSEIGRGGMGVVYRAWQGDLKRFVAVKVLTVTNDAAAVERFKREAVMASQVRHPAIVGVHEYGEAEGKPYIVMDLIPGEPLDRIVKKKRPGTRQAVEIVLAAAEGVAAAHAKGIVHRDIKPSNIIVDGAKVFLTDFGLAKTTDVNDRLTKSGQILGTPHYMSPEQAIGMKGIDSRCDVYALGAVLYELLTGKVPFASPEVYDLLRKIVMEEPVAPRAIDARIPLDLENVVLKCLEKNRDRRYENAEALAADLRAFLEHRAVAAAPVPKGEKIFRWVRRRPWLMAGAAGAIALVLGLTLFLAMRSGKEESDQLRDQLTTLQEELSRAKTAEERAAIEKRIEETKAKLGTPPPRPDTKAKDAYEALCGELKTAEDPLAEIDAFLAKFPDAPESAGAREMRSKIEAIRMERELRAREAEVDALCSKRRFGDALKIPGADRAKIEREAEMAWREIEERAKGMRPEEARLVLAEAQSFGIPNYSERADGAIAKLVRKPDPKPEVDTTDAVAALLAAGDLEQAKQIAGKHRSIVRELEDLEPMALAGFAARAGEKTELRLASGVKQTVEILGVRNGMVQVRVESAETAYRIKEIAPAEAIETAKRGGLSDEAAALAMVLAGEKAAGHGPLFEAVRREVLERLAAAALEALRKGNLKSLALLDGEYAGTKTVADARDEIEQIRASFELKGIDVLALVHATSEKMSGPVAQLEYAFASDAEMADLVADQRWNVHSNVFRGCDARRGDGLEVVNLRAAVGPAWRGVDAEIRVILERAEGKLLIIADPFLLAFHPKDGGWAVEDTRIRKGIAWGVVPRPGLDLTFRVKIRATKLEIECGERTLLSKTVDAVASAQIGVGTLENLRIRVPKISMSGVVDAAWAKREKREFRYGPVAALFNGRSTAGWGSLQQDRWRVMDGVLRGESRGLGPLDGVSIGTERRFRNGKLSFEYRLTGQIASVGIRNTGDGKVDFPLFGGEPMRWRKAEILCYEERAWAWVDGVAVVAAPASGTTVPGPLFFWTLNTAIEVRDVEFLPMDPPPVPKSWSSLLTPTLDAWKVLAGADGWKFEKGTLVADPPFTIRSIASFGDGDTILKARLAEGGQAVFTFRYAGDPVGQDLSIPGDGRTHEFGVSMRGDEIRVTQDGKTISLQKRLFTIPEGNLFLEVKQGKLELSTLKLRP